MKHHAESTHEFGGDWTPKKLMIVRNYLDAYTTALKKQSFELVYIDSHAGDGVWVSEDGEEMEGSPLIALNTCDKAFSELYLNDADHEKKLRLQSRVEAAFPDRKGVYCSADDADDFLRRTCEGLKHHNRGVVFFDPYNSQTSWSSMQAIAATKALDAIILYPAGATWRQLRNLKDASEEGRFSRNLTRFFGDDSWKLAYDAKYASELRVRHGLDGGSQPTMEGLGVAARSGHDLIPYIYKERLETEFGAVHMKPVPITINGSAYFEMVFAVSNRSPHVLTLALRIFNGVVRSLQ